MSKKKKNRSFYRAIILNPISDTQCEFWQDGVMVVQDGKVHEILDYSHAVDKYLLDFTANNCFDFKGQIIMPGFFDMHFHWVQDDVREMGKASLLDWLNQYTFPTEKKFASKSYAQKKAKYFFKRLSQVGTVGGACYSSIHHCALDSAMKEVVGDFVIGDVVMTMNSPAFLTQTKTEAIKQAKLHHAKYKKRFAFTPRFAITTDPDVMSYGGKLQDKKGYFKQTHLSENKGEIEFVMSLYKKIPGFEKVKSYTEIYAKTNMLGSRSLMGHAIHLSQTEINILKKTNTALIHCPTSNAPIKERGLGSGLFNFKKIEKAQIRWALASDIGGGPFLSMFDVMRSFVEQNKKKKIKEATYIKALYRSTLAGAQILDFGTLKGNLVKGKEANFIVVKTPKKKLKTDTAENALRSLIEPLKHKRDQYDSLVLSTYYQGKLIS